MRQVSASASERFLQCSRAFSDNVVLTDVPVGEPARWGSAWHEVCAWAIPQGKLPTMKVALPVIRKAAERYQVQSSVPELEAHLFASLPKLFEWLSSLPRKGKEKVEVFVEVSLALNLASGEVRQIPNPTLEDHHYSLEEGEIAGTADLVVKIGQTLYVIDHKTGMGDFSRPDKIAQVRTLAVMFRKFLRPKGEVVAGVFHAFRRGIAKMYTDVIDQAALLEHERALEISFKRIGDGTMRPGPACEMCPARQGCPAGDSELLMKAEGLLKKHNTLGSALLLVANENTALSRERQLGLLYETIQNAEALARRAREAIKLEMASGVLPILPSGKVLTVQHRDVERLSKTSYIETYGRLEAERKFNKLREDGALKKKAEAYIQPVDD